MEYDIHVNAKTHTLIYHRNVISFFKNVTFFQYEQENYFLAFKKRKPLVFVTSRDLRDKRFLLSRPEIFRVAP